MKLADSEAREIVAALRLGAVPPTGLHHFATGLDHLLPVFHEELEHVAGSEGRGGAKWVRGEYGSGKTFATRLLCARARERGFATAEVQISINSTPLHKLETVYRAAMERLTTDADGGGAFKAVVDGWLYEVGEEVTRLRGIAEEDPAYSAAVAERLEEKLAELSRRNTSFAQVLRAYQSALAAGDYRLAQGLVGWLAGQSNIDRSITSRAGVKGELDGQVALAFLRGVLLLLRQSGHAGLVLVLDEVETIQRMPSQTRERSLDALRNLVDMLANHELPGLYLVVTGTPDFYDGYKGIKALPALYQRVATRFDADPRFDNLRAAQVRLVPFDEQRLLEVGRRVRDLFPARELDRVRRTVDDNFLFALVEKIVAAFGGRISVCPRIFLRELVDVLDKVDLHPDYDPRAGYALRVDEDALSPEELAARRGTEVALVDDPEGEPTAPDAATGAAGDVRPRRLDE